MRQEHIDLDRVNALSKEDSALNHAQLLEQQATMFQEMENCLKMNFLTSMADLAQSYEDDEKKDDPTPPELTAALASTNATNSKEDKLIKMIEMLTKKIDRLETKDIQRDISDKENINPRTGKPFR